MVNSACFHDPAAAILDIVFIHGISGDHDTWLRPGKYSWPEHLTSTFPEARLISIAFASSRARKKSDKDRDAMVCAAEVLNELGPLGVGRRPFIMFCYSYGGLVAKAVLAKLMLAAPSEGGARAMLAAMKGIFFFDAPHGGSPYADRARDAGSDHLKDMASPALLKLLDETLDKVGATIAAKLVNIVRAGKDKDFLPGVARSETDARGVVTIAVNRSHDDVHQLSGPDDAVAAVLHGHIADLYAASSPRKGPSKNVVVHFLDHHYLASVGVTQLQVGAETSLGSKLDLLYRLALVVGDAVVVPASSVTESDICARLFVKYQSRADNSFCVSSHASFIDYIKATEESSKGIHDFAPAGLRHVEEIEALRMRQRARSATQDILKSMTSLDFEDLQRRAFAILPNIERLSLMEKRWGELQDSSIRQFLVPLALANHVFDGAPDGALIKLISDVVNEAYFLSFLVEFDAVLCRDAFPDNLINPVLLPPAKCMDVLATAHRAGLAAEVTRIGQLSDDAFADFLNARDAEEFRGRFWGAHGA